MCHVYASANSGADNRDCSRRWPASSSGRWATFPVTRQARCVSCATGSIAFLPNPVRVARMANERPAGRANRVRAYLQLMRFPAVCTALADIFLGFLLTHDTLAPVEEFVLLALASTGLYLSGMVLNDLFDRHIDARERPGRPIPSGRVSLPAAAALGCGLMAVGPLSAAFVGLSSLAIALVLVGLIVAYDRFLKHLPVGPVAMGACRFFNVLLGASAVGSQTWAPPQVFVALAMGVYVAGVTWFARQEAGRSSRSHLAASTAICHAAIVGLAVIAIQSPQTAADSRF